MQKDSILLSPIKINGLTLKNRITMAPLFLGYGGLDGTVNQLVLEHYQKMAESGAALIVVENAAVDPSGLGSPVMLRVDKDMCTMGLAAMAKTIQGAGALAFQQINHSGRYGFRKERIAPSPVPMGDVTPKEMTKQDIARIVKAFADASRRVKEAGFDGVELHGGTGYLSRSFFLPG